LSDKTGSPFEDVYSGATHGDGCTDETLKGSGIDCAGSAGPSSDSSTMPSTFTMRSNVLVCADGVGAKMVKKRGRVSVLDFDFDFLSG
jgi:hypothetical protein